jgi:hypothetical protein
MVLRADARRATRKFKTQRETLELGRAIAKKNKAALVVGLDIGCRRFGKCERDRS